MKTVGLLGLLGSDGRSEKYSLRSRMGLTFPSHAEDCAGRGADEAGRIDRGSGASAFEIIFASGRMGSFSPAGPGATSCGVRFPSKPAGGARKKKTALAPGGKATCFC